MLYGEMIKELKKRKTGNQINFNMNNIPMTCSICSCSFEPELSVMNPNAVVHVTWFHECKEAPDKPAKCAQLRYRRIVCLVRCELFWRLADRLVWCGFNRPMYDHNNVANQDGSTWRSHHWVCRFLLLHIHRIDTEHSCIADCCDWWGYTSQVSLNGPTLSSYCVHYIVYGTTSNTNLRQLDSIHNSGLRRTLGAFCTSPISSLYTEANETPLDERRLKLSMLYYLKTRACVDNPAYHALHEFDRTTRDLHTPRTNRRGCMTQPPAPVIGLKVEAAMASAEINAELVCPLGTPSFPPGTHDYDPKRHDLIAGVSKCMISREEAQAKSNEYHEAQGSHDEVYTDGSKMNERVEAAAVFNRHFQDGETTCR